MDSGDREGNGPSVNDLTGRIILKLLKKEGLIRVAGVVVRDVLSEWAGESRLRRRLSRIVTGPLSMISRRHRAVKGRSAETLAADMGEFLTVYARHINAMHHNDGTCHAKAREAPINDFIVHADFGELKEMVEKSEECLLQTLTILNETAWRYPGKVGSILAMLLSLANLSVKAGREMLRPVEEKVGPDLLADLVLSLMRRIEPKEVAGLINSVNECIRRLHTGSLLLSKGGTPLFEVYLAEMLEEGAGMIDRDLLCKARGAIAEDRESIRNACTRALEENPDMLFAVLSNLSSVINPAIRSRLRRLETIENLGVDDLAGAADGGLAGLDTDDIAECINISLKIFNDLYEERPELYSTLLNGITTSLDRDELRRAAERVMPETCEAFQPVFEAMMPSFVHAICDMADPSAGCQSEEQREAIRRLKRVLNEGDAA